MRLILLDANVVLRYVNEADPRHAVVRDTLAAMPHQGLRPALAPQVLYEFWVVAARPVEVNGMGVEPDAAAKRIDTLRGVFPVLTEPADLLDRWLAVCKAHSVRGKTAHDARLVALMQAHGVAEIATFNAADFARYAGIVVRDPAAAPA